MVSLLALFLGFWFFFGAIIIIINTEGSIFGGLIGLIFSIVGLIYIKNAR